MFIMGLGAQGKGRLGCPRPVGKGRIGQKGSARGGARPRWAA